jgi:hypothetical protein
VIRVSADRIFVAALAFATAHWGVEWLTRYLLYFHWHLLGTPSTPRQMSRLSEQLTLDMVVETGYAFWMAIVFCIIGVIARPRLHRSARRFGWIITFACAALASWLRWGAWWVIQRLGIRYSDRHDFVIATLLASAAAIALCRWWQPRVNG